MTIRHPDRLVADYLHRLEVAASSLPSERRAELVAEIRAHIDEALAEAGTTDEVTVRNVLERLGLPEEIVAAAGPVSTGGSIDRQGRAGGLEIAALIVLALGGFLPFIGWLVGVILVVASGAWSVRDKVVGLILGLLPIVMMFGVVFLVVLSWPRIGALGPLEIVVLCGFVTGLPSVLFLGWRLRQSPRLAL